MLSLLSCVYCEGKKETHWNEIVDFNGGTR